MQDRPTRSALLLLSMLSLLGLQYSVFMPIFANDILHVGARGLGLLMSAAGVGAVLGALQFAARTSYKGLAKWIAAMSVICAIGLVGFSQSHIFDFVCGVVRGGICSDFADGGDEHYSAEPRAGRIARARMAVYATMFMGVQTIGALLAGGIAKRMGAPLTLAFLVVCLAGAWFCGAGDDACATAETAQAQAGLGR